MKLFKSALSFGFLVLFFLTTPAIARDKSDGCGLGWEVTDENSFLGTSTRGTTNSTFVPTFSMTFGTSGCARHSIVKNESKAMHYAEANFASLMIEMSQGSGEFLAGFSEVLGCSGADGTFKQVMQSNYSDIYSSMDTTPSEMVESVLVKIKSHSVLSGSCYAI